MEEDITLYPSNWLYNAGVIGFLYSIELMEGLNLNDFLYFNNDGTLKIKKEIFNNLNAHKRYLSDNPKERIASIVGKSSQYPNYLQKSWKNNFPYFIKSLSTIEEDESSAACNLCYRHFKLPETEIEKLIREYNLGTFLNGIKKFDMRHNSVLGASLGEFPNTFWNNNQSLNICPLCAFLIIHHHCALIELKNNLEIFINAPSFKVMWYLNNYVKEIYGKSKIPKIKELLGISLIEMALKLNIQLGRWTMMNIEVISKNGKKIDFFNLPYETVLLLSDRNIASLLADIAELNVLNMVLNSEYKEILEVAERIFKISLKKEKTKQEKEFINSNIKLDENKNNLISYSQKLFKLYGLIEEKIKKEVLI